MPTTVKDCTLQCLAGVEEQGGGQGIWEVLEEILVYCQIMHACQ
jgi:hypothetical protein